MSTPDDLSRIALNQAVELLGLRSWPADLAGDPSVSRLAVYFGGFRLGQRPEQGVRTERLLREFGAWITSGHNMPAALGWSSAIPKLAEESTVPEVDLFWDLWDEFGRLSPGSVPANSDDIPLLPDCSGSSLGSFVDQFSYELRLRPGISLGHEVNTAGLLLFLLGFISAQRPETRGLNSYFLQQFENFVSSKCGARPGEAQMDEIAQDRGIPELDLFRELWDQFSE